MNEFTDPISSLIGGPRDIAAVGVGTEVMEDPCLAVLCR